MGRGDPWATLRGQIDACFSDNQSQLEAFKDKFPGFCRVVAIANQRGGVGKTTATLNIGACLAQFGYRVLLIDADPQSSLSVWSDPSPDHGERNLQQVMFGLTQAEDCVRDVHTPEIEGRLRILPTTEKLAMADYLLTLDSEPHPFLKMRTRVIEPLRFQYDFMLIDCPPSLSLLTRSIFHAAQFVVIPTTCAAIAVRGIQQMMLSIERVKEERGDAYPLMLAGVLINNRFRSSVQKVWENQLHEIFGDHLFVETVPRRTQVEEAEASGMIPVFGNPKTRLAKSFSNIARQLVRRIGSGHGV